jgi:endonuclease III
LNAIAPVTISPKQRADRSKRAPHVAPETLAHLGEQHPTAHCELDHRSPFELIISVVLSAQTTDVGVNKATPTLFARYPDARALGAADPKDVEPYVSTLGFFRVKARSIVGLARALVERHGGEVPRSLHDLVKLPGVGRKTANVVLGVVWNAPEGVVVDTHVMRISQRLGWTKNTDPEKIERDLCAILPQTEWDHASHVLIFHGRRCCFARKPACADCRVNDVCPAAFDAEDVGRKPRPGSEAAADLKTRKPRPSRDASTDPKTHKPRPSRLRAKSAVAKGAPARKRKRKPPTR